jgi:plasmid stability protein
MAQILVRNLEDAVLKRIKARARANKRSAEAEARAILAAAVPSPAGKRVPLAALAGAAASSRTPAEIDAYVRSLRDEWDR